MAQARGAIGSTESRPTNIAIASAALADGGLRLRLFHHGCANGLAFLDESNLAMFREPAAGGNKVTHDHVFLESTKAIHLPERSRFRKHPSRILERCGRNETIRLKRRLGNSEQYWHRFCGFTTLLDHALVFRFEVQF